MNARVIAEEKPTPFFTKIKTVVTGHRFISDDLASPDKLGRTEDVPKSLLGCEIRVDYLRFYGERVWYHFSVNENSVGWIQKKAMVRHYKRLDIKINSIESKTESSATKILQIWSKFVEPETNSQMQFSGIRPEDLIIKAQRLKRTARLINIENLKVIHHQIDRGHPLIIWLSRPKNGRSRIMLVSGYTHHHVYLIDPSTTNLLMPTNQALMGKWRGLGAQAIIY
ncbi:hypothetical protein C5L31_000519 [Secundilactobacillus malefermentans]|uniref:Peptidase C39-like domain-containing protein n=1 Tax=Secundilactobacillus malefermentans TaxID=176292 RepID=A0A4V3A440_9LACO|nr:hypothetical protein [Secundilactobacillus malefermentans]KRM57703.1 hypothetical protein FD44_GL001025 [Secundilactobacillus malefermentans DSM 5705 = KCTC 3548]TDG78859.1 hypothetical protein C5L31_000519 [Secundilactobacillus malefermentans]